MVYSVLIHRLIFTRATPFEATTMLILFEKHNLHREKCSGKQAIFVEIYDLIKLNLAKRRRTSYGIALFIMIDVLPFEATDLVSTTIKTRNTVKKDRLPIQNIP